jgi:phosphoribosylaminoimidazole-succinocarboxamide synthase
MKSSVLLKTDLPLPIFGRGKVRDTYELGDVLLVVATDRISAFDVILPCGIPDKGNVLNQLSVFWFDLTKKMMPNHLIEPLDDVKKLDDLIPAKKRFKYPEYLVGRSMLVKKMARINIECVVRGYLAG